MQEARKQKEESHRWWDARSKLNSQQHPPTSREDIEKAIGRMPPTPSPDCYEVYEGHMDVWSELTLVGEYLS
jgi:hypothetical protein